MSDLFSADWMNRYAAAWNNEPELADALSAIGFHSVIAYGFDDEVHPRGVLVVEEGRVVKSGAYAGEELNWDLRASEENWTKWLKKGIGMLGLGMAYTTRKLTFEVGDYTAMIRDPRMAGPFIKSFAVMGSV